MANKKNDVKAAAATEFDYSSYMPEGMSTKDLRVTGGLTAIYAPDNALESGFPPVGGWLDRFEILPEVKQGREGSFIPKMIRVVTTNDTFAVQGTKDAREVIKIEKGKDVLVPITGNLLNNKDLLMAVADPEFVHWCVFRVKGTIDIGQPSPMWDWDVQLHSKRIKREGRYAIPIGGSRLTNVLGQTSTGEVYDKTTGEVVGVVSSAAAAS